MSKSLYKEIITINGTIVRDDWHCDPVVADWLTTGPLLERAYHRGDYRRCLELAEFLAVRHPQNFGDLLKAARQAVAALMVA